MALFWPGAPGLLDGALGRMAAGPWNSAQEPQASGIYRTAQVGRGDLVTSVEAAGTLNALVVVDVGSQISGLVTDLFADFNSAVERGQVIARVDPEIYEARVAQDLSRMQREASVVEADVSRFAAGQVVEFTVDAFPGDVFPGTVRQIRKAPHVVQNVVTYVVVIDADNPGELMLPGMTANIRVVVGERTDVLLVPNAALRFRPAQAAAAPAAPSVGASGAAGPAGRVFRLGPDGQPVTVTLRLGLTDGRMTEVLSGDLGEGDHVIMGRAAGADAVASPILARFRLR
ncbi:efflux RND transporter periplasmic adaptor subunit [Limibaculum sp. FT325]|uniref:efflux RND transporter periplasmic adaptor subunit n=1 Tax=Thermohalobaculum sediminis TaxID=2939436 RepID=UPI0020BFDD3C|nr:efflux RND transporter periplasmic adaptor subunit [Limibaculum sediminis]MCL5776900.1 efflux RND transporter periplasmic adaptor subunit [Limibaculum sediminis]